MRAGEFVRAKRGFRWEQLLNEIRVVLPTPYLTHEMQLPFSVVWQVLSDELLSLNYAAPFTLTAMKYLIVICVNA